MTSCTIMFNSIEVSRFCNAHRLLSEHASFIIIFAYSYDPTQQLDVVGIAWHI